MRNRQNVILVTGATGNVGRQVVAQLLEKGATVRALTRNPAKAHFPAGVEVVRGDLSEPDSLPPALDGVTSVFLFPVPGSAPAFLAAAKQQAIRHVVMLSSGGVRDDVAQQQDAIARFHAEIEQAIIASGLTWTFVRPGAFATNTLQWVPQIRAGDVVRAPYGAAAMSPIHERDIAAVAVQALTTDGHHGAKYSITGPESLTQVEELNLIGEALGRPLRFEELPPDVAREQMSRYMPAPLADALLKVFASTIGKPAPVSSTVENVTGRPARTFREWAVDHVEDFR